MNSISHFLNNNKLGNCPICGCYLTVNIITGTASLFIAVTNEDGNDKVIKFISNSVPYNGGCLSYDLNNNTFVFGNADDKIKLSGKDFRINISCPNIFANKNTSLSECYDVISSNLNLKTYKSMPDTIRTFDVQTFLVSSEASTYMVHNSLITGKTSVSKILDDHYVRKVFDIDYDASFSDIDNLTGIFDRISKVDILC